MAEEMQTGNEELSTEELEQLQHLIGTATIPEEKANVHAFLTKVVTETDTSKVANLIDEELGSPKFPVRALQEMALFCYEIADMEYFGDYFKKEAEITLATSLSRDAKLIELAVTSNRQIGEIPRKKMKQNKGWFKKKGATS